MEGHGWSTGGGARLEPRWSAGGGALVERRWRPAGGVQVAGCGWSAGGGGVNSHAEGSDFSYRPSSCVALIKAKH